MGHLKFSKSVTFFMLPALALYLTFYGYPFLQTVFYSFTNWDGFTAFSFVGVKNFAGLVNDMIFRQAVGRIFIWAALSIAIK